MRSVKPALKNAAAFILTMAVSILPIHAATWTDFGDGQWYTDNTVEWLTDDGYIAPDGAYVSGAENPQLKINAVKLMYELLMRRNSIPFDGTPEDAGYAMLFLETAFGCEMPDDST